MLRENISFMIVFHMGSQTTLINIKYALRLKLQHDKQDVVSQHQTNFWTALF